MGVKKSKFATIITGCVCDGTVSSTLGLRCRRRPGLTSEIYGHVIYSPQHMIEGME